MKRSAVNTIIRDAEAFIASFNVALPPFAHWTPEEFHQRRAEADGIVDAGLG